MCRPYALTAVGILGIYTLMRLLLLWRMPHFVDEGTFARWTFDAYTDPGARFESLTDGYGPLMPWVAAGFMKLGAGPLTAIRWVSFCAGLVTMTMVGLLARRVGGSALALGAAAIYVVLPFFVVHDAIGIMDPLVAALLASALVLQLSLAERPRLDVALVLGLVMAAAVLVKDPGKLAVALLPLSLLVFDWSGAARLRRLAAWSGYVAIALVLTGIGELIPHLSPLYTHIQAVRNQPWIYNSRTVGDGLGDPIRWINANWPIYQPALIGYVTIPLLAAFVVGSVALMRSQPRLAVIVLGWVAVPLAAALLLPVRPYPRHLLYAMPATVVLIAYGARVVLRRVRQLAGSPRRAALIVVAISMLALAPALALDFRVLARPSSAHYPGIDDVQYVTGFQAGTGWPAVAATIRRQSGGHPTIVAYMAVYSDTLRFLINDPHVLLVSVDSPAAAYASYIVQSPSGFPDPAGDRMLPSFRLILTARRPRNGVVIHLYERYPRGRCDAPARCSASLSPPRRSQPARVRRPARRRTTRPPGTRRARAARLPGRAPSRGTPGLA
jgi:hypothetical protein